VYSFIVSSKKLRESIEQKYKEEDVSLKKKIIVNKFFDFIMDDSKTVLSQVQELQLILYDIYKEEIVLNESL
jgi:hypothetical protein